MKQIKKWDVVTYPNIKGEVFIQEKDKVIARLAVNNHISEKETYLNALLASKSPELLHQLKKLLDVLAIMFDRFEGELPFEIEELLVPHMAGIEEIIKEATEIK